MIGSPWARQEKIVSLPEKFDAKNPPCCVGMYSYEGEHHDIKRKYQQDIKYSKARFRIYGTSIKKLGCANIIETIVIIIIAIILIFFKIIINTLNSNDYSDKR